LIVGQKNIKMPKFLFKYYFLLFPFFAPFLVKAQVQVIKPKQEKMLFKRDSSTISPSKFDKQAISEYKDQKEFQYDEAESRQLSAWQRFWIWFWKMANEIFIGAASNSVSKYFFIGLGIVIVVYLIIKMIGTRNIFSKKAQETNLPYKIFNENIHEINYEQELQHFISDGKYRLAVRLLYLRALKKLNDADLIQWQPEKTNYNYIMEISKPELKSDFSKLTLQFDYIWYGDFPIDMKEFEPINESFNQFNKQIK